ncbi:MAG TPA: hypothetical protein VJS91_10925 [Nitrososphaeraceae archaeon]|nr:hypothetical protein [Nitrososphaeraceae archaeon]
MKTDTIYVICIILVMFFILNPIILQPMRVGAVQFDPVPFDKIPLAEISSNNGKYKIGADYSIDFGDEPVIKRANDTNLAKNMTLSKQDKGLSIKLECDSNDICGTSLAPSYVTIYLVNSSIADEQIVNNSASDLELGYTDCGTVSIKKCANFEFSIPTNLTAQNYSIVLDMSFDEAQWIFINPVKILN